jgi:hypothetical protein
VEGLWERVNVGEDVWVECLTRAEGLPMLACTVEILTSPAPRVHGSAGHGWRQARLVPFRHLDWPNPIWAAWPTHHEEVRAWLPQMPRKGL